MVMVDAWSPAEDSALKNQRRVTAQGSLPLEARENLMTHPAIYESNDPLQAWECLLALPCGGIQPLSDGKIKRIPPNRVRNIEVLLNIPE
ncbi:hypothetical protein TNCV_2693551 [Trichonephila clavipes]|nr:hypothetical protein TNCV_2693551 [Trichonephila clavipes]